MPFETAFSTERSYGDITALDANQLFFDGNLTDPHAFQCSAECSYPLTCKSFNKKSTEWKRAPHFCPGKNHSNSDHTCDKEKNDISSHTDGKQEQEHVVEKINDKISLNIFLSSGFDELKVKSDVQDDKNENSSIQTVRTTNSDLPRKKEGSEVNSLRKLLHYYYLESFPNDQPIFKTLDNKDICLNDLFFDLDKSQEIPNGVKVFFGTARIVNEPTYYVVRMKKYCKLGEIRSKPSVLVQKKNLIQKNDLSKRFERLSKESEFTFFYLGKIVVTKNKYLNFAFNDESKLIANLYLKD